MTPTTNSPMPSLASAGPAPASVLDGVRFQLDYLDAKLSEIGARYTEDLPQDLVHDLHSAWDAIQCARAALDTADSFPGLPAGVDFPSLLDDFTARWDRANEPIARLRGAGPVWEAAEWGAARARYEAAFVEAVRPMLLAPSERALRLRESAAELDRACREVNRHVPPSASQMPKRRRRN